MSRAELRFTDGETFEIKTAMSGDDAKVLTWMADVHDLLERHRIAEPEHVVVPGSFRTNTYSQCAYSTKVKRELWENAAGNGQSALILGVVGECLEDLLALYGNPKVWDTDDPETVILRWERALRFGYSPDPIEDRAR